MENYLFYERNSVSVLLIGDMARHDEFVKYAQKICKSLHVSTCKEEIVKIILDNRIDLIFGTTACDDDSCISALQDAKKKDETIDIILFLQQSDKDNLQEALTLKCNHYFCMDAEKKHAMQHLRDGIHAVVQKNIYFKGTQYFDALIENSIVSQSDIQGNITYVNDTFTKVTGYTKDEIVGLNHRILRHPSNPPEIFQEMWSTITSGKVWRGRLLNINKDGSDFWAETIIIPFKDEKTGQIMQYIAIRHDITQMLMEKRAAYAQELKATEQMRLGEAKDSFLILFTHELKTPLNAIINFSEYLHKNMYRIEEIPKMKCLHLLGQIYESASSMLENVTNILDLSKLRNNKINYTFNLFNVKESIQNVIKKHEALAIEHKKTIVFQDDGSDPYMTSDEYRFKQIIANILSNAIKYGSREVEVFLLFNKEKIEIIVEDDGLGIPDKVSVFELYEQSSQGLSNMEKKGTGIGLHFVKLLCEGLQFSYKLEDSSSLGGTKFILTKIMKEHKNV